MRIFFFIFTTFFAILAPLKAHQVDTVEFEFQQLDGIWRLHGIMDIAYMLPDRRRDPNSGAMERAVVMSFSKKELERIRKETENTLRKYLSLTHAGKSLRWQIEFPDFKKQPFTLPPDYGGTALITVNLLVDTQPIPGEFKVHWSSKERATLIILDELSNEGIPVPVEPGESLSLIKVSMAEAAKKSDSNQAKSGKLSTVHLSANVTSRWIKSGFLHVVPKGLDHMLFIMGLFLAVLAFKPMLWQSLLFTVAHSITLGACALGWLPQWGWVEVFIAVSIAFIGIENLMRVKIGKRRYIIVFIFGLIHGLGFASVFIEQVSSVTQDKLLSPLLFFNLGVELAQIAVIILAALLFSLIKNKKSKQRVQIIGSVLITCAGLIWMIQRIFCVDLTWGLL